MATSVEGYGSLILNIFSSVTIAGVIGYVVHSFYVGYKEFTKDAYDKIGKKVDKEVCNEYRRLKELTDTEQRRRKDD